MLSKHWGPSETADLALISLFSLQGLALIRILNSCRDEGGGPMVIHHLCHKTIQSLDSTGSVLMSFCEGSS